MGQSLSKGGKGLSLRSRILLAVVLTIFPVIALLFSIIGIPFFKYYQHRKALKKIPGPQTKNVIIGNLSDIPPNPADEMPFWISLVKKYGDRGFFPFFLGPIPVLHVVGPRAMKEILGSSHHTSKNFMYDFLIPWLGTGLLISTGDKWKARRRLTTPAFHFEVLQRYHEVMNEQADVMIEKLHQAAKEQKEIEIFDYITRCALDIICEAAMGRKIHAQNSRNPLDYAEAVLKTSEVLARRMPNPLYHLDFIYNLFPDGREMKRLLNILHTFTIQVIRERRQQLENQEGSHGQGEKIRPAFLDILLRAEVDGKPLTEEDIREEVDTFMFEGHDTSSASLAWTVQLLGQYPEVQEKVHQEIDLIMEDQHHVNFDMLGQFKYLDMVVKESLRLFPSVPSIGRVASEDFYLDGYLIPKGTPISPFILSLHRNPHVWGENAEKFDPERWGNEQLEDPYAYIPFSAGPRNCIGQKFAQNEEKVVLVKLLKNFKIRSLNAEPKGYPELILRPRDGIFVQLTPRDSFN